MNITKWQKPLWKGYLLYDSNYKARLRRWQKNWWLPVGGREGGRGEQAEPRGSQGIETTLYDAVTADTCHLNFSKPIGYTPPRGSPNVNYGLWVTVMCQCRFNDQNKVPLSWGMLLVGETVCMWGQELCMGNPHLSFNFSVNLKYL